MADFHTWHCKTFFSVSGNLRQIFVSGKLHLAGKNNNLHSFVSTFCKCKLLLQRKQIIRVSFLPVTSTASGTEAVRWRPVIFLQQILQFLPHFLYHKRNANFLLRQRYGMIKKHSLWHQRDSDICCQVSVSQSHERYCFSRDFTVVHKGEFHFVYRRQSSD